MGERAEGLLEEEEAEKHCWSCCCCFSVLSEESTIQILLVAAGEAFVKTELILASVV